MTQASVVADLLEQHGTTYAEAAGIKLADKPAPLFQLLVLTMLSSTRISADIAVDAARALFARGWTTPEKLRASTWQQRVDALGSAHYRRYDESTATALGQLCDRLVEEYGGDLRGLRPSSHEEVPALEKAITAFQRIGPTGASIFCREVQSVWPEVSPYFDRRASAAAEDLGLPRDPDELAALAPAGRVAELAAALARAARKR